MSYKFYFETMRVWQDSMQLVESVYSHSKTFPKEEQFGLTSQMRRAAVSISSNLAEGSARKSFKEQARFTEVAFSSLMELHCQITIAQRLEYLPEEAAQNMQSSIQSIARQLNALRDTQLGRAEEPEIEYESSHSPPPEADKHTPILLSSEYFVHPSSIVESNSTIGSGTKIWHFCHVMSGATIGANCSLGQNVFVANGVVLGDNVKVQNNVSIYEGVTCEDDVFLGPSMVFTNVINPRSAVSRKSAYLPTQVGKGASIGANATIICGNNIGKYAFIGAGAVVTKDVPDYALVVGNPAKQIGWMSAFGERLEFENGKAVCPGSGETYFLLDGKVTLSSDPPMPQSSKT